MNICFQNMVREPWVGRRSKEIFFKKKKKKKNLVQGIFIILSCMKLLLYPFF
jgi:hypothetical protein